MLQHMQKRRLSSRLFTMVLCVILFLTLTIPALAAYPTHTDFISDVGGVLSETTVSAIQTANKTLFASRGVKIAVCITDGTGDESITDFSRSLFSKWEMCDGVLLVLDTTNQTYFAVQSVDIDDTITNTVLSDLLANNMEEDFAAGNIDRAVMKTVTALSQTMTNTLPDPNATAAESTATGEEEAPTEDKPSGFVTFMKVILWIIIIAVLLAAGVFVVALFNDDVADFIRTYIFRRGPVHRGYDNHHGYNNGYNNRNVPHPGYYDDRLYGNQRQQSQGGQRRPQGQYPNGNSQYRQNPQYRQNAGARQSYDPYNDYEAQYQLQGQQRRQNSGYQNNGYQNQQRRPQNGAYPRQNQNGSYRGGPNQN